MKINFVWLLLNKNVSLNQQLWFWIALNNIPLILDYVLKHKEHMASNKLPGVPVP